jgi:hypothetical protein
VRREEVRTRCCISVRTCWSEEEDQKSASSHHMYLRSPNHVIETLQIALVDAVS